MHNVQANMDVGDELLQIFNDEDFRVEYIITDNGVINQPKIIEIGNGLYKNVKDGFCCNIDGVDITTPSIKNGKLQIIPKFPKLYAIKLNNPGCKVLYYFRLDGSNQIKLTENTIMYADCDYSVKRFMDYPDLVEQINDIYNTLKKAGHDSKLYRHILSIKKKYPKD